jgi:hypothetical protein
MVPVDSADCDRKWCAQTPVGRLCGCIKEVPEEIEFALAPPTGEPRRWKAAFVPPMGGNSKHFRVDTVDASRIFLAVMRDESVGIAISNWSVWAIDRQRTSPPLEVQNYGTLSFATRARPDTACTLLAARWHRGWDPVRGHGTYIAGGWFTIENGSFAPVTERPIIHRRYLFGVEQGRYDAESRDAPFLWFRSAAPVVGPYPDTGRGSGK